MYGCESWTLKKAECWRINAFELWCWRRLLRVPWTARISNPSIPRKLVLHIHLKDWCWSWNSNTLATWCEELTHWKRLWCWGRLKAGGERDNRGRDGWMASPTQWTWVWASFGSWWWTGKPGMLQSMESQNRTRLSNWTELKIRLLSSSCLYLLHLSGSCQIHLSPACFSLITPSYSTVSYMTSLTECVCVCVCVCVCDFFPLSFLQVYFYPSPQVPLSQLNRWIQSFLVGSLCFLIFP